MTLSNICEKQKKTRFLKEKKTFSCPRVETFLENRGARPYIFLLCEFSLRFD
jgi:hypothetical protein